ncbi:MAG: hypothetical protein GX076_09425 [Clostridiales bacterium]|nr:hypothetical protein [Clostridiales bacterium]
MESRNNSTKSVALGGILLALSLVTIFLASMVPGAELTLYAISSFYVALLVLKTSAINGWIFYVASFLLALALVPNKLAVLPYGMFFGFYGIIKYYIEKLNNQALEIILKLVCFNIIWGLGLYFFKELLLGNINLPELSNIILIIGAQVMFLLYDYIYTLVIAYYQKRLSRL